MCIRDSYNCRTRYSTAQNAAVTVTGTVLCCTYGIDSGFTFQMLHCHKTSPNKLLNHVYFCHQAVLVSASQKTVLFCVCSDVELAQLWKEDYLTVSKCSYISCCQCSFDSAISDCVSFAHGPRMDGKTKVAQ